MIQLISRNDALALNPAFCSALIAIQDAKYNPGRDGSAKNDEDVMFYMSHCDSCVNTDYSGIFLGNMILSSGSGFDIEVEMIVSLMHELEQNEMVFMSDYAIPWVQNELCYWLNPEDNGFAGALKVTADEVPSVLKYIFAVQTTENKASEVYFFWPNLQLIGNVTEQGAFHVSFYDSSNKLKFTEAANSVGFELLSDSWHLVDEDDDMVLEDRIVFA